MNIDNYLDLLEDRYHHFYDIERDFEFSNERFPLYARYFERNERYIGTKKMVVYGMEQNEHVLFQVVDSLNLKDLENFINILEKATKELVTPTEDHMSSLVRGVLITKGKPTEEVLRKLKKYKFYKSFLFGFHGWVNVGINVVDIDHLHEKSYHNKKGKEGRDHLFVEEQKEGIF
ncbi:MAG: hypothetical protein Q4Q07_09880 [Tissierellia bacterium]|nr:hypothetical protein [Tissierellia bacterium]